MFNVNWHFNSCSQFFPFFRLYSVHACFIFFSHWQLSFIVMVLFCVYPTCNILNFLRNSIFFDCSTLSKVQCSLFVLKVPLNSSQAVNQSRAAVRVQVTLNSLVCPLAVTFFSFVCFYVVVSSEF